MCSLFPNFFDVYFTLSYWYVIIVTMERIQVSWHNLPTTSEGTSYSASVEWMELKTKDLGHRLRTFLTFAFKICIKRSLLIVYMWLVTTESIKIAPKYCSPNPRSEIFGKLWNWHRPWYKWPKYTCFSIFFRQKGGSGSNFINNKAFRLLRFRTYISNLELHLN